jgi:hypothetical protein
MISSSPWFIAANNQGLVKKANKLCSFHLASASSALHSEYNMLASIHSLLASLPNPTEIGHVKGHQDDTVPYHKLSLPAKLICDTGILATRELFEYPTSCENVPLLPTAKVQWSLAVGLLLETYQQPFDANMAYVSSQNLAAPALPMAQ